MKGQRIKYIEHKFRDNSHISIKSYTSESTGANYRIVLDFGQMKYYIRNERTKEFVFKSKAYKNLNVLKRLAREELERFGVNLKKEVRDRTFGKCPKGYSQSEHERYMRENSDG
jgi:hypothetical protein